GVPFNLGPAVQISKYDLGVIISELGYLVNNPSFNQERVLSTVEQAIRRYLWNKKVVAGESSCFEPLTRQVTVHPVVAPNTDDWIEFLAPRVAGMGLTPEDFAQLVEKSIHD